MDIKPYEGSPCPVCGAPAEVVIGGAGFDAYCTIRCTKCGISVTRVNKDDDYCEYKEHATEAWEGPRARFCPMLSMNGNITDRSCRPSCVWFDKKNQQCAVLNLQGISNALGFIGMALEHQ